MKTSPSNKKSGKHISIFLGTIVIVLLIWGTWQIFFQNTSMDRVLEETAFELNRLCPTLIDSDTRLESVAALPPRTLQFHYTLINVEKDNVDSTAFKKYIEPILIEDTKTNPKMKFQRKRSITVNYVYKDKDGKYICAISMSPDKYK